MGSDTMDVKLSFKDFIETYMRSMTIAITRDVVPYVDGVVLLELYRYKLLLEDETTGDTKIAGHPSYLEVGIEKYVDFMLDMTIAFNEKRPS